MSATDAEAGLRRGPMLAIAAVGVAAFIAMLVLGAYAPDLKSGRNGGTHAMSNAATGFSGIVTLARATERYPTIVRDVEALDTEDLVIVSPDTQAAPLGPILEERGSRVTLIVLPKWQTKADPLRPGWVRREGVLDHEVPEGVLAPQWKYKVTRSISRREVLSVSGTMVSRDIGLVAPRLVQTIAGPDIRPVLSDGEGRIVLGQVGGRPLFVLADPDLINNLGISDRAQAAAALRLIDDLNSTDAEGVLFDVTANGFGRSRSPLKLAFDPPFLAVTLAIFAAMVLAGWQALIRFGAPLPPERAIAFGKSALVDNIAALVRKAGREARLGPRYADVMRKRAAALFHLPPTLDSPARDARLDALSGAGTPFSRLAAEAAAARTRPELITAARQLHDWIEEVQA